jgi:heptosyltransferase II
LSLINLSQLIIIYVNVQLMSQIAIKKNPKILVVKNRALGDAVIGVATIQYLRTIFPDSEIVYAVPEWVAPLFEQLSGDYTRVLPLKIKSLWQFYKSLKKEKFDIIFELQQRGTTANLLKIFTFFSRVPYFFHNHNVFEKTEIHDQGVIKPIIQRDLDGVWSILRRFYPQLPTPNYLSFTPKLQLKNSAIFHDQIIFGVVATKETKMWPLEHYVSLASSLISNQPDLNIIIPLSKSSADSQIEKRLVQLNLPKQCHMIKVSLDKLPEYLCRAKVYIGNDTGLKHICIALGVKTVTLFGPESPNEWHPYDSSKHPFLYQDPLACRVLNGHYCGLENCDSMICLNQFLPSDVIKLIS